jgi:hypothetical protein
VIGEDMKFTPLIPDKDKPTGKEHTEMAESFKAGHDIGPVTLGKEHLFVRRGLRTYCIAYADAEVIFRRVRRLHANICCGDGDIEVEYLVIQAGGRELMEVTLPGKKAAQMLFAELKEISPELNVTAPLRQSEDKEEAS